MGISSSKSVNNKQHSSEPEVPSGICVKRFKAAPLVYSRRGSRFFDQDGDLAHEFYEEVIHRNGGRTMKKVHSRLLLPEGEVPYAIPCIHTDYPLIMIPN
uniref:Tumor suppressor candidate 2 n=1 Tax=Caligus rogercresseyi TaxID=217165 RepID=C1BMJ1_CALRO|nr:Tumor suppressor candidate 2 [Caligus rogercresseyi]|eukprot:TRINITY_DN22649_c0_g1_i1.p1 TRINITY_DN22649_c0_g1~~TRINITY_DN22649_c0_g1_i1.p1  ORF type:complete len:100 (-),score=17.78 TRINITY_DN22649_c0_g1_i1:212-511(-)